MKMNEIKELADKDLREKMENAVVALQQMKLKNSPTRICARNWRMLGLRFSR